MAEAKKAKEPKEEKTEEKPKEERVEKKEEPKSEKKDEVKTEKKEEKKEEKKGEKKEKKKKDDKKVDIVSEDVYTVPLKAAYQTKPCYRRTNKAVAILQKYLERHTKSDNVKIANDLNLYIWAKGAKKPPRKVQIKAVKDSEGKVIASLLK